MSGTKISWKDVRDAINIIDRPLYWQRWALENWFPNRCKVYLEASKKFALYLDGQTPREKEYQDKVIQLTDMVSHIMVTWDGITYSDAILLPLYDEFTKLFELYEKIGQEVNEINVKRTMLSIMSRTSDFQNGLNLYRELVSTGKMTEEEAFQEFYKIFESVLYQYDNDKERHLREAFNTHGISWPIKFHSENKKSDIDTNRSSNLESIISPTNASTLSFDNRTKVNRKELIGFSPPNLVQNPLAEFLDQDQLQAVQHRGCNLLILAGAGSGKTRALTYRAVFFLQEIEPENIMVVTFTKKAANELITRIYKQVPENKRNNIKRAWIGTIHSICWRILKDNGHLVNLKPNWSVLDMADSQRLMYRSANTFGFNVKVAKDIHQLYSYSRNSLTDWSQWIKTQRFPDITNPILVGKAIESYRRRCARSSRVDFDDLQVLTLELLQNNEKVRKEYQDRFKVIMIDEYQDTNLVQAKILELLATKTSEITVVGDDAQAIYGFRAATVENILNFEKNFSAKRVTIKANYRSTPEIVALSNASILKNRRQLHKEIRSIATSGKKPILFIGIDPQNEAKYIVQNISKQLKNGSSLNDLAVLFRATRLAAALEIALKQVGIPYVVVGGEDFFAFEHIKLALDMARLLVNPDDSIALSALQELIDFSSPSTLEVIENQAEQTQLSFWDIVNNSINHIKPSEQPEYQSLSHFGQQIDILRNLIVEGNSITPVMTKILEFLDPFLKKKYPFNWDEISKDYDILQSVASQFISLSDFLFSVALQQFKDDEIQADKLVLSTIHGAKGLEWRTVFILGLVEFWFPLRRAIEQSGTDEEERRLFYVAVTRAKKELYLTSYLQSLTQYGTMKSQQLSRFIQELSPTVYERAG